MSESMEYKCPSCGGAVAFDSAVQKLKCPYCESEYDIESDAPREEMAAGDARDPVESERKTNTQWDAQEEASLASYGCQSCGAEIIGDADMGATACLYCGNNVVIAKQFSGDLRPDYIIPFKLDKEAAKAKYRGHLEGKRLLPKIFKKENHIEEIKRVYVPFWLFDADAFAKIQYRATRTHTWSDSQYDYTKTDTYDVKRSGSIRFSCVPVDGSEKIDDALMESIEPYHFSDAVEFNMAYLAGCLADRYSMTAAECEDRATERMERGAASEFMTTLDSGYSSVTTEHCSIKMKNGVTKYALYPVWFLSTRWKGKQYYFAMNGQTGKFVGDLPIDTGAYYRFIALLSLLIGGGIYGLLWLIILM